MSSTAMINSSPLSISDAIMSQHTGKAIAPWTWEHQQINSFLCSHIEKDLRDDDIPAYPEIQIQLNNHKLCSAISPRKSDTPCQHITAAILPAFEGLTGTDINVTTYGTFYYFKFSRYAMPVPASIYIGKRGVPFGAYQTAEGLYGWSTSETHAKLIPGYDGQEFSKIAVIGVNIITTIAVAQRQMEAMEKGNMVPKNTFEAISLYVPCDAREILVFSATFDRQFLESLKTPGKPLEHGFNMTESRIRVTKDGKDIADVIRAMIDVSSRIGILEDMAEQPYISRGVNKYKDYKAGGKKRRRPRQASRTAV